MQAMPRFAPWSRSAPIPGAATARSRRSADCRYTRIPIVASGLSHAQHDVRCATIAALGQMRHPDASTAIRSALADADARVRVAAVTVLDGLGVRGLARVFAQLARDDDSRAVRRTAADALSRQEPVPDAAGTPGMGG